MSLEKIRGYPALITKGFDIHPPYVDLALEPGDTYSFVYAGEKIYTIFDGSVWRFICAVPSGICYDFDTSVVTVL